MNSETISATARICMADCSQASDGWVPVTGQLPADTPVAESLPDDCTLVLLAFTDGDVWPGYRDGAIWRDATAMPIEEGSITDWMHLPPAPTRRPG